MAREGLDVVSTGGANWGRPNSTSAQRSQQGDNLDPMKAKAYDEHWTTGSTNSFLQFVNRAVRSLYSLDPYTKPNAQRIADNVTNFLGGAQNPNTLWNRIPDMLRGYDAQGRLTQGQINETVRQLRSQPLGGRTEPRTPSPAQMDQALRSGDLRIIQAGYSSAIAGTRGRARSQLQSEYQRALEHARGGGNNGDTGTRGETYSKNAGKLSSKDKRTIQLTTAHLQGGRSLSTKGWQSLPTAIRTAITQNLNKAGFNLRNKNGRIDRVARPAPVKRQRRRRRH